MVAARYAQAAPEGRWGALTKWSDLDDLVQPLHRELAQLDVAIGAKLRVRDLQWRNGNPVVTAADRMVIVVEETVGGASDRTGLSARLPEHALTAGVQSDIHRRDRFRPFSDLRSKRCWAGLTLCRPSLRPLR